MQPAFIVIGNTNIDENITSYSTSVVQGGAGYFSAIAASRIINGVGFVTRYGQDFDARFLNSRVLPDGLKIIDRPTNRSIQTYSKNDLTDRKMVLKQSSEMLLKIEDFPKKWLGSAKFIHIATMIPNQQLAFLLFLRKTAPQAKISIDTDVSLLQTPQSLEAIIRNFSLADIVFANRREYSLLKRLIDVHPSCNSQI